jgi:urocanate hydratase
MNTLHRQVSAPHGATITGKGRPLEAARRMLMNNRDPQAARRPEDLAVSGGSGGAAACALNTSALLDPSCGTSRVSVHHGSGAGTGYSLHAGMVVAAGFTRAADERLERVRTCDPGLGVGRHGNAGHPEAIAAATRAHMDMPMGTPGGAVR